MSPPVQGVTAKFTLLANAPSSVVVSAAKRVPGATATLGLSSSPPTSVVIKGGKISATGTVTAKLTVVAGVGAPTIGGYVIGDLYAYPFTLTGISGSKTIDFNTYDISASDPGGTSLSTVWFYYQPPYPGTLTVTVPAGSELYVVDFNSSDAYEDYVLGAGTETYVTSGPTWLCWGAVGTKNQTQTLNWSFAADTPVMNLSLNPNSVAQTPTSVAVFLDGGPASSVVTFAVSGYPSSAVSITTDSAGSINGGSMAIPAVPAGSALITATFGTYVASANLAVLAAPPSRPTTVVADAAPTLIAQSGTVVKWVLFDPAPGGTTYTFPINPASWTSPHAPRNVMVDSTTQGNPIMWEGAIRSHSFTFSGYLDSQATYDALEAFRDLGHRFWIADHRNRAWVCTIDSIDWTPKRVVGKPWAYNYAVHAQVYKGPVAL